MCRAHNIRYFSYDQYYSLSTYSHLLHKGSGLNLHSLVSYPCGYLTCQDHVSLHISFNPRVAFHPYVMTGPIGLVVRVSEPSPYRFYIITTNKCAGTAAFIINQSASRIMLNVPKTPLQNLGLSRVQANHLASFKVNRIT